VRRLFWVAVGAAGGIWAYRRGGEALDNARERGVVGNIAVATATVGKVAGTATRVIAVAAEQGSRVASKVSDRSTESTKDPGAASAVNPARPAGGARR
jgi:hypothetical protein